MKELLDPLRSCLSGLRVRAWRLHLETPGVQATVPMLRGVWGAALHELDRELYGAVFEGGVTETPRYLLRPAAPDIRPAPALEFVLFGPSSVEEEGRYWLAWEHALCTGLGPHRIAARLVAVHPLAWDGTALAPARRQPGFGLYPLAWPCGEPHRPCALVFPVPLRLIRNGRLIVEPALPDVVLAALRRLQALAPESGAAVWAARGEWLEVARAHPCGPWHGYSLDLVRYSGRQQQELELHGVAGELPLPSGPGPLADLLAAAQWLHLGKGTVMGLGQMHIFRGASSAGR